MFLCDEAVLKLQRGFLVTSGTKQPVHFPRCYTCALTDGLQGPDISNFAIISFAAWFQPHLPIMGLSRGSREEKLPGLYCLL